MADVSVRQARPEDAAEIARIQIETWRQAYTEIIPAAVLESLSVESAREAWADAIASAPSPQHHLLIALEQQWTVGFTALGPADPDEPTAEGGVPIDPATTVALAPLLVEPRWGRRGHGSRLVAAAVDHARRDGATRAIIWIPEQDQASKDFLISAGWAPDGLVRALDTGAGELREIRLHTDLT